MKFLQVSAMGLVLVGCVILACFLNKASVDGLVIANNVHTDYQITGQFGDFVGGVVGTFFALSGTLLIYLNFKEQTKENKRSAFEASFFEMIRLYRDNVSELKYVKNNNGNNTIYENRQVLREIFKEFIDCYREIKKFSNSRDEKYYFNSTYAKKLKEITLEANIKANIIEMAIIDLAFMIVFFGLSSEGEQIIKSNIQKKYNRDYYYKLIYFIKLKPKRSNTERYNNWIRLLSLNSKEYHAVIDALYSSRKNTKGISPTIQLASDFKMELPYDKYYGGHQFRLGHYFRHLFQSYKYLNNHPDLQDKEKYEYGKMYRAQLSTYEQALLLVNSISSLGMKWELTPENTASPKNSTKLITKYNLIKNLPGKHLSGIRYATYYPNVSYESDENT